VGEYCQVVLTDPPLHIGPCCYWFEREFKETVGTPVLIRALGFPSVPAYLEWWRSGSWRAGSCFWWPRSGPACCGPSWTGPCTPAWCRATTLASLYYGHRVPMVLLLMSRKKLLWEFKAEYKVCNFSIRALLLEVPANYVTMTSRGLGRNTCVLHTELQAHCAAAAEAGPAGEQPQLGPTSPTSIRWTP
jgi:hypothetical protein